MSLTDNEISDIMDVQKNEINQPDIIQEIKTPEKKVYPCTECSEVFDSPVAKATHVRVHHPKGKSSLKNEEVKVKDMLPESLAYLQGILKSFSAKNISNIVNGLLDSPENLDELRDLLVASGTDTKAHPLILRRFASYIGQPVPNAQGESTLLFQKPVSDVDIAYQEITKGKLDKMKMAILEKEAYGNQNNNSNNNTELKQQIADMQRSFSEKIIEMQRQFKEDIEKNRTHDEINSLKKALEDTKAQYGGMVGGIADSMKESITSLVHFQEQATKDNDHKFATLLAEMKHSKEIDDYKNRLDQANSSKPMAEKVFDKTTQTIDSVLAGTGAIFDKSLKSQDALEKANAAMLMKQQGFSNDTINNILNPNQKLPSAKDEYENLQRMTSEMQTELEAKQTQKPQPEPQPEAIKPVDFSNHIKFNAGD